MGRYLVRSLLIGVFALALTTTPGLAQQGESAPVQGVTALLPGDSVTEHALPIGKETLRYTATAGTFPLFDGNGDRAGSIFYTAYTVVPKPGETRPVTFAFNGGPGAASAYLHLGAIGPRVVDFGQASGSARDPAGARLRDNPDTWLKFTDLVFIDPVGTGWSRAAKADKVNEFWNVRADAQSLAKAIALYVATNSRGSSPKYLLGESYGGYRSVKVARVLQQDQGLFLHGIVMVSPFLDGRLLFGANRFPLGAALQLPSLAAAALDRRDAFTPDALAAAERFALTDYLVTLAGTPPKGDTANAFYARVADIAGVPVEVVARTRGFIGDAYVKQATDERRAIASHYDAAFSAPDPFPESASADSPDPVLDGYTQALGGLFVAYARDELGFKTDLTFTLLNRETSRRWEWDGRGGLGQASVERDLRELLALDPKLGVFVAHGRSDMTTPYAVTRYMLDHLPPAGAEDRTELSLYKGGHMFYFDADTRAAFSSDASAFYRRPGL